MRKVMLATPSYDGRVEATYAHALAASTVACLSRGIELVPVIVCYDAQLPNARNDLLAMAVESPAVEDIVWVDADIGWQPADLLRLLDHRVDVVGGTYPRKDDSGTLEFAPMGIEGGTPGNTAVGTNLLAEVAHLGTGFLRVSRRAFMACWEASPPYQAALGAERRWVFDAGVRDGVRVTEDVVFCRLLQRLGFAVYFDTAICCAHTGSKTWVR